MNENYSLVIGGEPTNTHDFSEFEESEPVFILQDNRLLHIEDVNPYMLKYLIASILRKPRDLIIHLQRISLCYQQQNEEQLYAALVDFFVVLQSAGLSIKQRILAGARKQLSPMLLQRLQIYVTDHHSIQGNLYSVLTSGIESDMALVLSETAKNKTSNYDALQLARDYIEYSQLEEAREMLESAILTNPDYAELHVDLLELYKSTKNIDAFNEMKQALSQINHLCKRNGMH